MTPDTNLIKLQKRSNKHHKTDLACPSFTSKSIASFSRVHAQHR